MKKYKFFYSIACVVILFISYTLIQTDQIVLVENGVSNYDIVLPNNSSQKHYKAATILQSYISKISKCTLAIHTTGTPSKYENHIYLSLLLGGHSQQINIATDNTNLIISAGSDIALINAAYEFLENALGCMWLAPGIEKIPSTPTITIEEDLHISYLPKIETRTVHSRLFYENPDFALKHKVTDLSFPYYVPEGRVHTFHKFISEEKFYKTHPDYFAMRNGKRLPTQLCLTNDKVLEIVKDSVKAMFLRYPDSDVISVSSNDNTQYCTCENCKAVDEEEGSHAGTMIRFVNAVAQEFSAKTISTLAYQYTRKPCKTAPSDNVLITLCSIECDRSASIPEKCKDFAEDLRGWKQLTENIRIWDYTTQFTNFLAPFPNLHTLKPNIKFFVENNAKWIFEQHSNNPSELFELRSYVLAKLLWNPDSDYDMLISEFTNGYYEEAGPYIKKYIDLIHEKIKEDEDFFLFLYGDPSQAFDSYLSGDLLDTYSQLFEEAELAVSSKPEVLKRVKEARLGVDFSVLEACRKSLSEQYNLANDEFVSNLLANFKNTCLEANITMMNEMRYSVDEYCSAYQRMLSVTKTLSMAEGKPVVLGTKPKKYADENPQALTDGAYGGSSFYANWLGFEGNDLIATIDLGSIQEISSVNTAFLQVTNHIVFFPSEVQYSISEDGIDFSLLGSVSNQSPLEKTSKINDLQYFEFKSEAVKTRFIQVHAINLKEAPYWHHAAGLPSWIFADEVIVH